MGGPAQIKGGPSTHNETMDSVLHCPAFFSFFQNCPALSCILGYKCPAKSPKKSCIVLHFPLKNPVDTMPTMVDGLNAFLAI